MIVFERFAHPGALLLLILPVILLAFGRRNAVLTFPFDHLRHRDRPWLRRVVAITSAAPACLLAIAIVAVARPQQLRDARALRTLTNIQIVLDVSRSMLDDDRYRIAAAAVTEFTRAREGDAMGLTLFGTGQVRWVPITKDLDAVRNALPFADPARQPQSMWGTEIGAALRYVRKNIEAEAQTGDRLIVLVTDGISDDVMGGDQHEIAEELIAARCTLYYVHVAADVPMVGEVAEIARATGGEGMTATDGQALNAVFRHIDRMKPAKFVPQGPVQVDALRPAAVAALVMTLVHVAALFGLRYTPW